MNSGFKCLKKNVRNNGRPLSFEEEQTPAFTSSDMAHTDWYMSEVITSPGVIANCSHAP
jgi:hypothetical protein